MILLPGLNSVQDIRSGPSDGPRNGEDGVNHPVFHAVVYLQVSVIGQAVIFVSRSPSLFFLNAPPSWQGGSSSTTSTRATLHRLLLPLLPLLLLLLLLCRSSVLAMYRPEVIRQTSLPPYTGKRPSNCNASPSLWRVNRPPKN